jgi:hypothetical protein
MAAEASAARHRRSPTVLIWLVSSHPSTTPQLILEEGCMKQCII